MTEVEFKQKYEIARGASFPGYYCVDEMNWIKGLFSKYPVLTIKHGIVGTERWVILKNPKSIFNGVSVYAIKNEVIGFMACLYPHGTWFAELDIVGYGCVQLERPAKCPTDEPLPKLPPQMRRSYTDVAPDITADTMRKITSENDEMKWKLFVLLRHIQSDAARGDTCSFLSVGSIITRVDGVVRAFPPQRHNMPKDGEEVVTTFSEDEIKMFIPYLEQRGFIIKKDETTHIRYVTW